LKDASFYGTIRSHAGRLRARDLDRAVPIIRRSAVLHLEHITTGGDPFENRHARPLDFGHWAAHKLETMTGFELSHGYAVSIGVALDTMYSELSGYAARGMGEEVASCLAAIGLPVWHPALARTQTLMEGLEEFREHLGGRLTITLVRTPGEALDVHEIDRGLMQRAAERLAEFSADDAAPAPVSHPAASPSQAAGARAARRYAG
jgi:3-dehydroquinate synthase